MFERAQFAGLDLSISLPALDNSQQKVSAVDSTDHGCLVEPSPTALRPILDDEDVKTSCFSGQEVPQGDETVEWGQYGAKTDLKLLSTAIGERPEDIEAMYAYKLQVCPNKLPHDWTQCNFAHEGEVARRRSPAMHSANPCAEYEKTGSCRRGDRCPFAHGVWERGLHPQRFRTSLCSKGEACCRKICFFAHRPEQIRKSVTGFHHAGLAGFHGLAGIQGSEPWVGKVSRRRKQQSQHDRQEKKAAQERLDPGSATFVPNGRSKKDPAAVQRTGSAAKSTAQEERKGSKAEQGVPHTDQERGREAKEDAALVFRRQRSLEHSMLWAKWARKATAVDLGNLSPGQDSPPPLRSEKSFEEREERALEKFNTGWVEGLLSEDIVKEAPAHAVAPDTSSAVRESGWSRADWTVGSGLTVSGNNREWTRWVMRGPLGASHDESDLTEKADAALLDLWGARDEAVWGGSGAASGVIGSVKAGPESLAQAPPLGAPHPISPPCGPGALKEQEGRTLKPGWVEVEVVDGGDREAGERPPALFCGIHPCVLDSTAPAPAPVVLDLPWLGHSS